MSEKSFYRVESRLTIAVSDKTADNSFGYYNGLFTEESVRLPVRSVQVVERLGEMPMAVASIALGTPFGDDIGEDDTEEVINAMNTAVAEQYLVAICLETVIHNLQTGKETKDPEEILFLGFIMSPTTQLMRKDTGSQIQLRHYASTLANASVMAHFAIETPENRFASAALWSGQGAQQGLAPGQAELIISKLNLPRNMLQDMRDRDLFRFGPLRILTEFAEKSVPKILQQNWSSCSTAINEPSEAVQLALWKISPSVAMDTARYNVGSRQLIASKIYNLVCRRTLADFAGGSFWDKLQQYASLLDTVIDVSTYHKPTNPVVEVNVRPLAIASESYVEVAAGHITDLRWQANTNIHVRGVVLASTTASPTNLTLPAGVKTYGCFIDNVDPNKGSVKHMSPPVWLNDLWLGEARAGNASNFTVDRGGVVGKPTSAAGQSTAAGLNAAADFGKDEFKKLLDLYAKWIYLQVAFMGRTVTYSTQFKIASTNEKVFENQVKLNEWAKIDTTKINTRFTRTTRTGVLYGLVVGKTTILSRENATRTVNYQLDYVMTEAEYEKYKMDHPLYSTGGLFGPDVKVEEYEE